MQEDNRVRHITVSFSRSSFPWDLLRAVPYEKHPHKSSSFAGWQFVFRNSQKEIPALRTLRWRQNGDTHQSDYSASYAFLNPSISIFPIPSIACITLADFFGSLSPSISPSANGIICHDNPNLSFNHPHRDSVPPAVSFAHSSSTSSCVLQSTKKDIASVNLNIGPPFSA